MDALHPHCAGLDVHKDTVVACVRHAGPGGKATEAVRTFGTVTSGLLSLLLANAHHIKQVPGRKTDVKDCQWIAQLLQHGLLRPSFVPERPQRELRDLTRQRAQLVADRARVSNRIQKVLEDANVKLGSVASDVLGASGRDMLKALVEGQSDAAAMAELARFRMRAKIPQLREALSGRVTDHHRFMLGQLLAQVEGLDAQVAAFDAGVGAVMTPLEREAVARLDGMPGVEVRSAQVIVAEVGTDMGRFPSAGHLASWAGLCPGNNESAGKRRTGRVNPGNPYLRATLCQCALAAGRKKGSYYSSQYPPHRRPPGPQAGRAGGGPLDAGGRLPHHRRGRPQGPGGRPLRQARPGPAEADPGRPAGAPGV